MFGDGGGAEVRHAVPRVEAEARAQEELRQVLAGQHVSISVHSSANYVREVALVPLPSYL